MKKLFMLLMAAVLLAACGNGSKKDESNLSMTSFIDAYEGEGVEVDSNEKPMFEMIGAKDGIIFYNENEPVKIYEFESEKAITKAEETLPAIKDWNRNGLFVIETNDERAKSIFNNVK